MGFGGHRGLEMERFLRVFHVVDEVRRKLHQLVYMVLRGGDLVEYLERHELRVVCRE